MSPGSCNYRVITGIRKEAEQRHGKRRETMAVEMVTLTIVTYPTKALNPSEKIDQKGLKKGSFED